MSYQIKSRIGEQLWRSLPAIYRTRDKDGQLAAYLEAFGELLDRVRNTLDQQLADVFPDPPADPDARRCQSWIVPYLGDLVAAKVLSPEEDGQREEVANAIRWRQRKGTLTAAEEIAEKVGQIEVQLHEGWKRIATTARVQIPLVSVTFFGVDEDRLPVLLAQEQAPATARNPLLMTYHPGVAAGTVDFRQPSRAVRATESEPLAQSTWFDGMKAWWKQRNPRGAPCFPANAWAEVPGSFEDQTARTVDVRDPAWNHGQFHPRRLLVFHAPPRGIWRPEESCGTSPEDRGPLQVQWGDPSDGADVISVTGSGGKITIANATTRPVEILGDVLLNTAASYEIENLRFAGELNIPSAHVELRRVEARRLVVDAASPDETALTATDSLFEELIVGSAPAVLQRCTVLSRANLYAVEATDCLFPEDLAVSTPESERGDSYEFLNCRVPASVLASKLCTLCTADAAVFFSSDFGDSDAGVLRPDTPPSITAGSSQGRELGCFHDGRPWPVRLTHLAPLAIPAESSYVLADVIVEDTIEITEGILRLERAAIERVVVSSAGEGDPVLEARGSIFRSVAVPSGLARLEYCTVLGDVSCEELQASDCIFAGTITGSEEAGSSPTETSDLPARMCIRSSRVPPDLVSRLEAEGRVVSEELASNTNTTITPAFYETTIGFRSVGVLHPATPAAICTGSEDGGEMGAYHDEHYCLRSAAVIQKLGDYLPVGIIPVLVPDHRLLTPPPTVEENPSTS